MTLHVLGKNPCSEPKKRWLESIQTDMSCPGLSVIYIGYLNEWTSMIKSSEQKFVSNRSTEGSNYKKQCNERANMRAEKTLPK